MSHTSFVPPARRPDAVLDNACTGDGCSLCRDHATRARVISISGTDAVVVDESGSTQSVAVDLIPGVALGDHVLVQLGVALSRIPDTQCVTRAEQLS